MRDEARYPDLDTLTRQIHTDVERAREFFDHAGATR
ncbi:MAG: riboflavin kinase [Betaproteobacteria bacterium]